MGHFRLRSSLAHDLHDCVLVYRSPLRKLDTSPNQLCASLDKDRASGKLLSFSVAGTAGGCGQSTASIGCLLAHPLKISAKIIGASKSGIALLPRLDQRPVLRLFFLTMLYS